MYINPELARTLASQDYIKVLQLDDIYPLIYAACLLHTYSIVLHNDELLSDTLLVLTKEWFTVSRFDEYQTRISW